MGVRIQGKRLSAPEAADSTPLPRKQAPARPEWRFGFKPGSWDFQDATGDWLPQLAEVAYVPGVNGVRALRPGADGRERVDAGPLHELWRRKGGFLIDPWDERLAEWKGYIQSVENDARQMVHFSVFESFVRVGNQVRWKSDQVEYSRFRRHMIEVGMIAPCDPEVKARAIEIQEDAVGGLRRRLGAAPAHSGIAMELRYAEARLQAMREERPVADFLGEVAPLPGTASVPVEEPPAESSPAPPSMVERGRSGANKRWAKQRAEKVAP